MSASDSNTRSSSKNVREDAGKPAASQLRWDVGALLHAPCARAHTLLGISVAAKRRAVKSATETAE